MTAVTGSFSATGQSSSLQIKNAAQPGEILFNIYLDGTGVASIQLEKQPPGSSSWYPIYAAGAQLGQWSYSGTSLGENWSESEAGVLYRLNCTAYTSGTVNYQLRVTI